MSEIVIGVDESGTGAWAGSFTVCAVAMYVSDDKLLREHGVDDSKKISDKKRRRLVSDISDVVLCAHTELVGAEKTFNPGMKMAWRLAVSACTTAVVGLLPALIQRSKIRIIIDGNADKRTRADVQRTTGCIVRFRKQADSIYPVVGAASIIAKTVRNDHMIELHKEYPVYGWKQNYGYGTKRHRTAIEQHGVTEYHRRIKPLMKYFGK